MNTVLSPIVSEFASEEEAQSYDLWFRAKVQESLDDPRPSLPHDEAMARVEQLLSEKRTSRAARHALLVSPWSAAWNKGMCRAPKLHTHLPSGEADH
jgi:hypothetical protein